jgi:hypothetical protein
MGRARTLSKELESVELRSTAMCIMIFTMFEWNGYIALLEAATGVA